MPELFPRLDREREMRLDQRHQPRRRDRFRNDVVEADTRDPRFVELRDEAGEREDRDLSRGETTQLADESEAIRIGQHQILEHHARLLRGHQLARRLAIGRFEHLVPAADQRVADHPPCRRVVVDDQDLVPPGHVGPSARATWRAITSGRVRVSIGLVM